MVSHYQRNAVISVNPATQFADSLAGVQERLSREGPERNDHAWFDQLDLPQQVWTAGLHLVRHWIAISGRTVLENIADENLFARELDCSEDFVQ